MPKAAPTVNRKKALAIAAVIVVGIIAIVAGILLKSEPRPAPVAPIATEKVRVPVKNQAVIDFEGVKKDPETKDLMSQRKAEYGIQEGLDMIARSDESVKIGDRTVSMQEIADKIRIKGGEIIEKDLNRSGGPITVFGIHVVQPGDNIWNIHFRFLREYFKTRGVSVSPLADEPDTRGFSSGVGKLLKFSENMVHIYNLQERRIDVDLNLIQPLSKIVVYNMEQIFSLLEEIEYEKVSRIQFDGENIWIPADQ